MLDLELASRITIITNRALCGGEVALLARIADLAAAGVGEIVVREKDLYEAAYAALFENILRACEFYDRVDGLSFDTDRACPHEILPNEIRTAKFDAAKAHEGGFGTDTARSDGIFAEEVCARAIPHKIYDDRACAVQALVDGLDAGATYADQISLRERDADEVLLKKFHSGGSKSELCADAGRKYGAAMDEARHKNSTCVLDEILSENFIGAANCENDSAPDEISLRGAICKTKLATRSAQGTDNANGAEGMQGAVNTESSQSAQHADNLESEEVVENSESVKKAENSQSAESVRCPPAVFVHNFADFALRAGERNLWLPLGVLRSFSAAHGAEFLRANFKKLVASCHNEAEVCEALELGANAICLSHIFATDCKAGLAPKGLNLIYAVREFFAGEIYALGGITPRNFTSVLRVGADRIAVMSSAMTARDATSFIAEFQRLYQAAGGGKI